MGQWSVYCPPPSPTCPTKRFSAIFSSNPPTALGDLGTGSKYAPHTESVGGPGTGDVCTFFTSIPISDVKYQIKNMMTYIEREYRRKKSFSLALWARCSSFSFGVRSWKLCSPPWPLAPQSLFPYLPHNLEAASPTEQIWPIQPACHQLLEDQKCLSYSVLISWYRRASRCSVILDRINIQFSSVAQSCPTLCDPSTLYPQVLSLCLRLYSCIGKRFICTIFLDSTYIH